ncbi:hypothetical protein HMPREF1344_01564 [Enterococcus faecalis R508]|nr:hypothetical protein HMPREF1344_01564 [Enterococcus faecalis R508]
MVSGRCARIKPLFNKKKVPKDLSIDNWTLFYRPFWGSYFFKESAF